MLKKALKISLFQGEGVTPTNADPPKVLRGVEGYHPCTQPSTPQIRPCQY